MDIQTILQQQFELKQKETYQLAKPYSWSASLGSKAKTRFYIPYASCSQSAGAAEVYDAIQKYIEENNVNAEIVKTSCSGFCSEEPVFGIDTKGKNPIFFKKVSQYDVELILDGFFHSFINEQKVFYQYKLIHTEPWRAVPLIDDIPFFSNQKRELLNNSMVAEVLSIDEFVHYGGFLALYSALKELTQTNLIDIVKESGLKGRGGEGFPTAKKWQIVKDTASSDKFVICNAHESDPSSYVDRFIVENMPYKVIEGIALAAYACGASKAFVFMNRENKHGIEILSNAIENAIQSGCLGDNIFNSGFSLKIQIFEAPGALVCGEETALISCIEGGRATPRIRPPYPATNGLWGKPTAVNNIETLVCVSRIIFDKMINQTTNEYKAESQTKLVCLSGEVQNKGIAEVKLGTKFHDLIYKIGGGIQNDKKFKALLLGGVTGTVFSDKQLDIKLAFDDLKSHNAIVGSGGFFVMADDICIVDTMKYLAEIQSRESCGKCIPCREGTIQLHEILTKITGRPIKDEDHKALDRFKGVLNMENIATIMHQTSMCNFGKYAPQPLLSSLKEFRSDFEEHVFDRKCATNKCRNLRKYYIDARACTGCGACSTRCPVAAIFGTPRETYAIIESKCIGCGKCQEACMFNAVFYE